MAIINIFLFKFCLFGNSSVLNNSSLAINAAACTGTSNLQSAQNFQSIFQILIILWQKMIIIISLIPNNLQGFNLKAPNFRYFKFIELQISMNILCCPAYAVANPVYCPSIGLVIIIYIYSCNRYGSRLICISNYNWAVHLTFHEPA